LRDPRRAPTPICSVVGLTRAKLRAYDPCSFSVEAVGAVEAADLNDVLREIADSFAVVEISGFDNNEAVLCKLVLNSVDGLRCEGVLKADIIRTRVAPAPPTVS
jgi:hypothetical protein